MKPLEHLQTATGATRSEVIVVAGLIIAILVGHLLRSCQAGIESPTSDSVSQLDVVRILDSIAKAEHTEPSEPDHSALPMERVPVEANSTIRRSISSQRSPINLNTASSTRLQEIPGVGQATAERIIEYRKMTPFRRPEDVMLIRGIGEKKFAKMQPYIVAP